METKTQESNQSPSLKRMVRVLPGTSARVETGPVQFGDDWPGVFIRGDNAGFYALCLKEMLDGKDNATIRMVLTNLQGALAGCVEGPAKQLLEMHPNTRISNSDDTAKSS